MSAEPIKVLVTGAAGNIGYALIPLIAQCVILQVLILITLRGDAFGRSQPLILHLLELENAIPKAEAVAMELADCAFPLLRGRMNLFTGLTIRCRYHFGCQEGVH
eukprot:TRINITY_DN10420_c0_g2_i7.p1 TRINITY_DN10420_c0_g2~~TRINITY_DN10420_c0_g2_i7.p1  ORF type:complete len:105 (-),score=8.29 TRINITY_DN10420_c0_g2_i7:285-599(-)